MVHGEQPQNPKEMLGVILQVLQVDLSVWEKKLKSESKVIIMFS